MVKAGCLAGKYKATIYQHWILPRLLWLVLLHDVSMATAEGMKAEASPHQRRWLGVSRSFRSIGLWIDLEQYYGYLLGIQGDKYTNSKDEKVRRAIVEIRKGRRWSVKRNLLWNGLFVCLFVFVLLENFSLIHVIVTSIAITDEGLQILFWPILGISEGSLACHTFCG